MTVENVSNGGSKLYALVERVPKTAQKPPFSAAIP
jgi:hypothetical protein